MHSTLTSISFFFLLLPCSPCPFDRSVRTHIPHSPPALSLHLLRLLLPLFFLLCLALLVRLIRQLVSLLPCFGSSTCLFSLLSPRVLDARRVVVFKAHCGCVGVCEKERVWIILGRTKRSGRKTKRKKERGKYIRKCAQLETMKKKKKKKKNNNNNNNKSKRARIDRKEAAVAPLQFCSSRTK